MFLKLFLSFTIIPFLEIAILIKIGHFVGVLNTISIVFLTGVFGAYLARHQGLNTLKSIKQNLNQGIMPTEELFNGFIILVSGILLLTPGLLTDVVAFLGLIPLTRGFVKNWLKRKAESFMNDGKTVTITSYSIGDDR